MRALAPLAMPCPDPSLVMTSFLVTAWSGEPVNAAPDEHDELRWFVADDLPALVMAHPSVASALATSCVRPPEAVGHVVLDRVGRIAP